MKTIALNILLFLLFLAPAGSSAQTWVWPMAGHKAGENIVSAPNSYINDEFNCCDIYISGEEGDYIVSPVEGTILYADISYCPNIGFMKSYKTDDSKTWDENLRDIEVTDDVDPQYLSGYIDILIADGRKVAMSGLRGDYKFRKGQHVSAGDTLGRLGWSYKGVRKPSLLLLVSLPNSVSGDPMSPFGLESNFRLEIAEREDPLPVEKMREDLTILEEAMKEIYPSLNDRMSDEEFHNIMESLRQSVTSPVPLRTMEPLARFSNLLHDSHLLPKPDIMDSKPVDIYIPALIYSWCDDTLRVVAAKPGLEKYNNKVVKSIDGLSPANYVEKAKKYIPLYDLDVRSTVEEKLVLLSSYYAITNLDATAESKSRVVFADGEEVEIPYEKYPYNVFIENTSLPRILTWKNLNQQMPNDSVYSTRKLNDSTAYLSLKSFNMGRSELNRIQKWIGECKEGNMIVDLRNNSGGDPEVMNKLLACFAQQPLSRQRGSCLFVNKLEGFDCQKYIFNHSKDERMFPDYVQLKGKPGFYCFDTLKAAICIMPDSGNQYAGRVYVLTNGQSMSCATVFPAVLVRNRRGVTVGRETGSTYHYITALETADISLPNSMRVVSIPMVKVVFDTTVCARTPWGRGLLPDYELPLTYNEVTMGADGETDVMLEYALSLIADGKYLSEEDPFAEADANHKGCLWLWIVAGVIVVASAITLYARRRREKTPAAERNGQ